MESWDEARADGAVAGLARSAGAHEVYDLFHRLGSRDFRDIGHKAIFVANSWRTLQFIGWQHAEPVLRSLAFALLQHDLDGTTPDQAEDPADHPGRRNQELAAAMGPDWMSGTTDAGATRVLLGAFREESNDDACDMAVSMLANGVSPQSIWDAVFLASGELLMRQPGIIALHAMTSTNALRYAYEACGIESTRRQLLLQNCAFIPMFRQALGNRVADVRIDAVDPLPASAPSEAIAEIFIDMGDAPMTAAEKIRGYVRAGGDVRDFMDTARRHIFMKGRNAHDYKFSEAVLEDYFKVSPEWREAYLASSTFYLKGTGDRDNALIDRARSALAG